MTAFSGPSVINTTPVEMVPLTQAADQRT